MKKKKENKKLKKFLNYIYICVVLLIFAVLINIILDKILNPIEMDESLFVSYDLKKDLIPDPIQKSIPTESINVKSNGINYRIDKLATYDITAKVESIKDYNTSKIASKLSFTPDGTAGIDMMSPRDLTVSWGKIALLENNNHVHCNQYEGGYRYSMVYWTSELGKKYSREEIISNVSNNHVITIDKNLKKILLKIKEEDIIRIVGYLVYVEGEDGTTWGPSSMERDDIDMHSCEIILAEKIVIMP